MGQRDFAIVFRPEKIEAIVPLDTLMEDREDLIDDDERHHIDSTIAYVMHCMVRDDWQEEFFEALDDYLENTPSVTELEAQTRRAQFKLITNDSIDEN